MDIEEIARIIYESQHDLFSYKELSEEQKFPWRNSAKAIIEYLT